MNKNNWAELKREEVHEMVSQNSARHGTKGRVNSGKLLPTYVGNVNDGWRVQLK